MNPSILILRIDAERRSNYMGKDIVGQIIEAFKEKKPELYVIAIWEYNGQNLIVAKHTPDKDAREMDPFYTYAKDEIIGVAIQDKFHLVSKIMTNENLIYERQN